MNRDLDFRNVFFAKYISPTEKIWIQKNCPRVLLPSEVLELTSFFSSDSILRAKEFSRAKGFSRAKVFSRVKVYFLELKSIFLELESTAVFHSVLLAIYTFFLIFFIRLLIILYTNYVKSGYFFLHIWGTYHHSDSDLLGLKSIFLS